MPTTHPGCRRLLQDDSDRAKAVLRDVLYGNKQRLDIDRITRLADGFGAFTTDGLQEGPSAQRGLAVVPAASPSSAAADRQAGGAAGTSGRGSLEQDPGLDPVLRDALVVMFGRRGSYVQVGGERPMQGFPLQDVSGTAALPSKLGPGCARLGYRCRLCEPQPHPRVSHVAEMGAFVLWHELCSNCCAATGPTGG